MSKGLISLTSLVLIWIIIVAGLVGVSGLAHEEFVEGGVCPEVLRVPACYIIFICFIFLILSHANLLKDKNLLFFAGAGVAEAIALSGSAGQLMGWLECPKTESGTPMCYLSLGLFTSLLVLKVLQLKSVSGKSPAKSDDENDKV